MEDTASQEMARALENFKGGLLPPEILRAQGIVDICTERMSRVGLKHLEDARAARPDLPFCDRALSQAHMLVGKSHAGTDRRTALTHALNRGLAAKVRRMNEAASQASAENADEVHLRG